MTIYKQVNNPTGAAAEDVKIFMDRSVSGERCRCRRPLSRERSTPGQEDVSCTGSERNWKVLRPREEGQILKTRG